MYQIYTLLFLVSRQLNSNISQNIVVPQYPRDLTVSSTLAGFQNDCLATGSSYYFDTVLLKCQACTQTFAGLSPDSFASDGSSCACASSQTSNQVTSTAPGSNPTDVRFYCVDCAAGTTSLPNQQTCIDCAGGDCTTPAADDLTQVVKKYNDDGSALTEYTVTTCATAQGYYANSTRDACIWCGEFMEFLNGNCACVSGFKLTSNGMCILDNNSVNVSNSVGVVFQNLISGSQYPESGTVNSEYINQYIEWAAYNCQTNLSNASFKLGGVSNQVCQVLANIATLQDFNGDFQTTLLPTLGDQLPKVFTNTPSQNTVILSALDNVLAKQAPSSGVANDVYYKLPFILQKQDEHGNFINAEPLTNQLFICGGSTSRDSLIYQVGANQDNSCTLDLKNQIEKNQKTQFQELYLQDQGRSTDPLVKVPIKNNNNNINKNIQGVNDVQIQLSYRFYLIDQLSGLDSVQDPTTYTAPAQIKQAKEIKIRSMVQSEDRLQIPQLEISQASVDYNSLLNTANYPTTDTFQFSFGFQQDEMWLTNLVQVSFFVVLVFVSLTIFMKIFVNERKVPMQPTAEQNIFMDFILRSIQLVIDTSSHLIWWQLIFLSGYIFIWYKYQNALSVMVPQDALHQTRFNWTLWIVFIMYMATMLLRLQKQVTAEVYLLDMEPQGGASAVKSGGGNAEDTTPCWRRIFVANELTKLFTIRFVCIELTLFIQLILYQNLGYIEFAQEKPFSVTEDTPLSPNNKILQFFLDSAVIFVLGILQILYFKVVNCRLPTDHQNFADVCSVTNISCFIIDEPLHGWYIHGYSSVSSDTSFCKLLLDLNNNKDAKHRQLKESGEQTFEVFFNENSRKGLDNLFKEHRLKMQQSIQNSVSQQNSKETLEIIRTQNDKRMSFEIYWKEIVQNPNFRAMNMNVRLFGMPDLVLNMETRPLFYNDPSMGQDAVFLQGIDYYLLIMDALIFAYFNFQLDNIIMSAFLTYIIDKTYCFSRGWLGSFYLASSTFIQHKFLVSYNKQGL